MMTSATVHPKMMCCCHVFGRGILLILQVWKRQRRRCKALPLPHDQAEKDKFWLSPPRYTTVIPVIAKADSMTIDEKWECQRALAVALRQKKTIKWVNLRQQFPPGNPAAMVRCALPLARGGAAVHMPCMLQPASLDHTCSTHEA